jgi:hypothetical protein
MRRQTVLRRAIGSAGILAVLLWILAGCSTTSSAPITASPGMKVATLTVKGMT